MGRGPLPLPLPEPREAQRGAEFQALACWRRATSRARRKAASAWGTSAAGELEQQLPLEPIALGLPTTVPRSWLSASWPQPGPGAPGLGLPRSAIHLGQRGESIGAQRLGSHVGRRQRLAQVCHPGGRLVLHGQRSTPARGDPAQREMLSDARRPRPARRRHAPGSPPRRGGTGRRGPHSCSAANASVGLWSPCRARVSASWLRCRACSS